jgi:hypothetical protein
MSSIWREKLSKDTICFISKQFGRQSFFSLQQGYKFGELKKLMV